MTEFRGRRKSRTRMPPRAWLQAALTAFQAHGGMETIYNRLPLTLFIVGCYERGMSETRAGVEAADKYLNGELGNH